MESANRNTEINMNCKDCKREISASAKFCKHCGQRAKESNNSEVASENSPSSVDRYFASKEDGLVEEAKKLAEKEMMKGLLWFGVGLAITIVTYFSAASSTEGGTYYIFWGAMIYGIYRLIRGFDYKSNPNKLIEKARENALVNMLKKTESNEIEGKEK